MYNSLKYGELLKLIQPVKLKLFNEKYHAVTEKYVFQFYLRHLKKSWALNSDGGCTFAGQLIGSLEHK